MTRDQLLTALRDRVPHPATARELLRTLAVPRGDRVEFKRLLKRLVADGSLVFYAPQDLVVRASVPPTSLVQAVRAVVARVDPQQPVADVRPLADVVQAETAPRLAQLRVLGAFAVLAFLLAGLGIYGLLAFSVAARTREIGVRMALGAGRGRVLAGVLGHGVRLAVAGVVAGTLVAVAAGRALEALLAGVSPTDGPTLAAAVALAFLVTLAGSLLPALRASHVDPIVAMRDE
ncbi:MAG: FtsX-like permease family protein [Vicinamibacteria bacterium]